MTENPSDSRDAQDTTFLERVAGPLRSPEFLDESFGERLMERIRREGSAYYPGPASTHAASWWRSERVVRLSPLTGLAVAAGLAGIIALSSLGGGARSGSGSTVVSDRPAVQSATRSDTVHVVRFVFVDSRASTVEIVGDFNAWTKGVTRLERSGAPGVWAVSVALPSGRHEYAFIVNGSRWIADPLAAKSSDDFGTESAVISVGATGQSET